jgi:hypothetical protein
MYSDVLAKARRVAVLGGQPTPIATGTTYSRRSAKQAMMSWLVIPSTI